jgi:transmembrane sensor
MRNQPNSQIRQEAAEWFVTLRDDNGDSELRAQFAAWLTRSPEHVRTYLELTPIWAEAASLDLARHLDPDTLMARARADTNIVEISESRAVSPVANSRGRRINRLRWALAAAAAILFAALALGWYTTRPPEYITGIGEQRSITLPDGSTIEVNARSRMRVLYTAKERHIDLLEGQGFFVVAKHPNWPFIVDSGDGNVRAVGTQFDVYRKPSGTIVTVLEGKVEASTNADWSSPLMPGHEVVPKHVQLAAGEQAVIAPQAITRTSATNLAAATAWQKKQLIFDAAPLAEVAGEFNRYNFKQLVIRDPAVRQFLVSGVFSSTDPASLMRFLSEQPELTVSEERTQIVISQK